MTPVVLSIVLEKERKDKTSASEGKRHWRRSRCQNQESGSGRDALCSGLRLCWLIKQCRVSVMLGDFPHHSWGATPPKRNVATVVVWCRPGSGCSSVELQQMPRSFVPHGSSPAERSVSGLNEFPFLFITL
ncbi:uncharacterized [Tachysurus ichikawai]